MSQCCWQYHHSLGPLHVCFRAIGRQKATSSLGWGLAEGHTILLPWVLLLARLAGPLRSRWSSWSSSVMKNAQAPGIRPRVWVPDEKCKLGGVDAASVRDGWRDLSNTKTGLPLGYLVLLLGLKEDRDFSYLMENPLSFDLLWGKKKAKKSLK